MSAVSLQVVAVLLPDRVGILRDVTAGVVALEGNIQGIRQSVVDGFFSLVFTAAFPSVVTTAAVHAALTARLDPKAAIVVQAYAAPPSPPLAGGARYVAMTRGPDRAGTIHAISSFFVEHGINIEDWQVGWEDADVIYTAQVVLPEHLDISQVQTAFRARMAARGLTTALCHENIFRATTEVGPIKGLLLKSEFRIQKTEFRRQKTEDDLLNPEPSLRLLSPHAKVFSPC